MDDRARATYRSIAWGFLVVAAAVVAVRLGELAFGFVFFQGSPLPTALFLGAIGGLLLWTVRGAGDAPAARGDGTDATSEPPPFRLRDLGSVRPSGGAVDGIPPPTGEDVDDEGETVGQEDAAREDGAGGRRSG